MEGSPAAEALEWHILQCRKVRRGLASASRFRMGCRSRSTAGHAQRKRQGQSLTFGRGWSGLDLSSSDGFGSNQVGNSVKARGCGGQGWGKPAR